ncbi:hypothetical protein CLU96_1261 [Chryseobacterium sp. 52]|uniref:hypothetical protein n=1 Tax=Chryseobacterium sp. 52 TaxID=2035213 RepID=UPI000C1A6310|nr:hypothetical protein [Chryseobacterium sp. 52]PIF44318.1 hypothetical protein CLU96_1261 [Chryseobacterium sp. 52]
MKTKEELLKIYSAYLPYELECEYEFNSIVTKYSEKRIGKLLGVREQPFHSVSLLVDNKSNNPDYIKHSEVKPILYHLSYLTKEIEHEGETFVPVEYFEITDDHDSYPVEYDHGNIKLIKDLESIANHNSAFDIKFLPFEVVIKLIEWHFNVFNLDESEYINKATLK